MAGVPPYIAVNNKAFFAKLIKGVQTIVIEKAEDRAENIDRGLRFRQNLLGEGGARFPMWQGESKGRTDDNSYRSWKINRTRKNEAHFTIYNDHSNSVDDHNYVRQLFWGVPMGSNHKWAKSVANGNSTRLAVSGGKIFSSQMPRGLVPYFNRQDKLFYEDMQGIQAEYNRRHK